MITETRGNLLSADAEALVNTVNTVGVMGKGIALQFKNAYPEMFKAYQRAAKAGELQMGQMFVWETGLLEGPRYIINFPTKSHWRQPSRLRDIEVGLTDLTRVINQLGITSVALPPLGCGNGGLRWNDVEPVIKAAFSALPEVEVLLYAPSGTPKAADVVAAAKTPAMTPGRAALVTVVDRYLRQAFFPPSLVEVQKLMYFLQAAGEPLRLNFAPNRYGPYADNLRHVLNAVEGHYLVGYGDGSAKVEVAEPIEVLPGAVEEAGAVLAERPDTCSRIARVVSLAEGFESAYGMELLATVHWVAGMDATQSSEHITRGVQQWSPRKAKMFTDAQIEIALEKLRAEGWLDSVEDAALG